MKKICMAFLACASIIGSAEGFYAADQEELMTEEHHAEESNMINIDKDLSNLSPEFIQLSSMKIVAEMDDEEIEAADPYAIEHFINEGIVELADKEKEDSFHAAMLYEEIASEIQAVKTKETVVASAEETERKEEAVSPREDKDDSVIDTTAAEEAEPEKKEPVVEEATLTEEEPVIASVDESREESAPENTEDTVKPEIEEAAEETVITMTATAYTADCEGGSGVTYTGIDLKANPDAKVIAVDPSVIPLGTEVYVEGYGTAIAADIGGAIKGNKIDVFIPSQAEAEAWGIKTVNVTIKQ